MEKHLVASRQAHAKVRAFMERVFFPLGGNCSSSVSTYVPKSKQEVDPLLPVVGVVYWLVASFFMAQNAAECNKVFRWFIYKL